MAVTPVLFCSIIFFIVCMSTWNLYIVTNINNENYLFWQYYTVCNYFSTLATPEFALLEQRYEDHFTSVSLRVVENTCNQSSFTGKWKMKYRPLVGDHIHLGYRIIYNGEDVIVRDRNLTEPIPYEMYPATCENPPEYAYIKQYYHTGVHTHCDGLIHVHPWSAPKDLRKEGRDVTLGMWFESVGITASSTGDGFRLPGHSHYIHFNMAYFVHVNDEYPAFVTSNFESIVNLWLVDHHGGVILWSGDETKVPKFTSKKVLDYESYPHDYPRRRRRKKS